MARCVSCNKILCPLHKSFIDSYYELIKIYLRLHYDDYSILRAQHHKFEINSSHGYVNVVLVQLGNNYLLNQLLFFKLAHIYHYAVPFLSRAAANFCWYTTNSSIPTNDKYYSLGRIYVVVNVLAINIIRVIVLHYLPLFFFGILISENVTVNTANISPLRTNSSMVPCRKPYLVIPTSIKMLSSIN